jgi:two-component system, response regulator
MTKPPTGAADIVLVEDDANDAEFVTRTLSQVVPDNKILFIRDGADFLEYLFGVGKFAGRNINVLPKVILLDLKLPRVNGIEALQTMKDDPQTRAIPVVIFTSSREEQDVEMCYSLGASSYVVKPSDRQEYAEVLQRLANYWLKLNEHPR